MPRIDGQEVGEIAYGLMGLTWTSEPAPQEQAFETLRTALKNGCNFWNGGEFYGPSEYNSAVLLERYFEKYPEDADKVVLSIKGAAGPHGHEPNGKPEEVRRSLDATLRQLNGRKKLDVFECARRDQGTPLEVTFGVLKEYIDAGKLGGISLSEVRAETIHEAVKIAKVVAVEVELSLLSTEVLHNGVAAACAQYGIPLLAYAPLGRGILAGRFQSFDDLPKDSMLRHFPRFQPGNFEENMKLFTHVQELARKKGCTPAQLAINWVKALSRRPGVPTIIPLPGGTTAARVNENVVHVDITDAEMDAIDALLEKIEVKGDRYPDFVPMNT